MRRFIQQQRKRYDLGLVVLFNANENIGFWLCTKSDRSLYSTCMYVRWKRVIFRSFIIHSLRSLEVATAVPAIYRGQSAISYPSTAHQPSIPQTDLIAASYNQGPFPSFSLSTPHQISPQRSPTPTPLHPPTNQPSPAKEKRTPNPSPQYHTTTPGDLSPPHHHANKKTKGYRLTNRLTDRQPSAQGGRGRKPARKPRKVERVGLDRGYRIVPHRREERRGRAQRKAGVQSSVQSP